MTPVGSLMILMFSCSLVELDQNYYYFFSVSFLLCPFFHFMILPLYNSVFPFLLLSFFFLFLCFFLSPIFMPLTLFLSLFRGVLTFNTLVFISHKKTKALVQNYRTVSKACPLLWTVEIYCRFIEENFHFIKLTDFAWRHTTFWNSKFDLKVRGKVWHLQSAWELPL